MVKESVVKELVRLGNLFFNKEVPDNCSPEVGETGYQAINENGFAISGYTQALSNDRKSLENILAGITENMYFKPMDMCGYAKEIYGDFNTKEHIILEPVFNQPVNLEEPLLFVLYNTKTGMAYFMREAYCIPSNFYLCGNTIVKEVKNVK